MFRSIKILARRAVRRLLNRYAPPEAMVVLRYLRADSGPAFPARNIVVTEKLPVEPVLILSPHPDDEIIGMGGTLAMHLENGSKVTALYLTDGAGLNEFPHEMVCRRRKEAEAVGRACGLDQIFWEKTDTRLTNDRQTVADMTKVLKEVRPSIVYLPSYFDHHYDHFSTNQILVDALKVLPLTELIVNGYEVWDHIPFQNYVVDISKQFEKKKALMEHYVTPLEVTDFVRLVKYRGAIHYMLHIDSRREKARNGYAEAFCRFDAPTYVRLYSEYARLLAQHRSPMLSHIQG